MQRKVQVFIVIVVLALAGVAVYTFNQSRKKDAQLKALTESLETKTTAAQSSAEDGDRAAERTRQIEERAARAKNSPSANIPSATSAPSSLAQTNAGSALSSMTQDPQMRKTLRDQQKMGMTMIYGQLAKQLKLTTNQTDQLNNFLADHVMDNVDQITKGLAGGKSAEEMDKLFTQQDLALQEKIEGLLGADGLAKYQDYTRNLASTLTSEQFKGMLTGDKAAKDEHARQLADAMREETEYTLRTAGLDPNFQTVPMLNFRNIASEEEANKNLKLLDDIYSRVSLRAGAFLSPEEVAKFGTFRTNAINMNRMAITMNRKMMAPNMK